MPQRQLHIGAVAGSKLVAGRGETVLVTVVTAEQTYKLLEQHRSTMEKSGKLDSGNFDEVYMEPAAAAQSETLFVAAAVVAAAAEGQYTSPCGPRHLVKAFGPIALK